MDTIFILSLIFSAVSCASQKSTIIYGCRYNAGLCSEYELCAEDNLFGTCQNILKDSQVLQFRASGTLKEVLQFSLAGLLELGYGWKDEYTQCIIGGLLQSYELYLDPDLTYCDEAEKKRLSMTEQQHESQETKFSNYRSKINMYDSLRSTTDKPAHVFGETTPNTDEDFLSKLSVEDLQFIHNYLSATRPPLKVQTTPPASTATDGIVYTDEGLSVTDQWLLEQLTSELITVDDLTTTQIKRLRTYLQHLLSQTSSPEGYTSLSGQDGTTTTPPSTTNPEARVKSAEEIEQEKAIIGMLERFTAESMKNERVKPEQRQINMERSDNDVIGQQISNQMKQIQNKDTNKYVDKKSETKIAEAPDKAPEMTDPPAAHTTTAFKIIDTSYVYLTLDKELSEAEALELVLYIADELNLKRLLFSDVRSEGKQVTFQVNPNSSKNSTQIATLTQDSLKDKILTKYEVNVLSTGIGHSKNELQIAPVEKPATPSKTTTIVIVSTVLVVIVVVVLILITWRCMYKRWSFSVNRFEKLSSTLKGESTQDSYEDLCRQRMGASNDDQSPPSPASDLDRVSPLKSKGDVGGAHSERLRSPRSSTSSWSEEPVNLAMDISTGHTILSYMESHLKNTKRLEQEWSALEDYIPDRCDVEMGKLQPGQNRYPSVLPYDHNRVKLKPDTATGSDYINASFIADHDLRSPAYIVTQGPLQTTVEQFWQMIWEQECTSIVMLTSLAEHNKTVCYQYWPSEGMEVYGPKFEVHLVSEHNWCEAYLVRSLYLKNRSTSETRTVTQFHFLSWAESSVPDDCRDLLDFRRKVNKSYRGKTSPILVCCSNGSGRSGTYTLLDNVINRIHKGVKEIDIAATLEHIRDQRMGSVETKEQFEFTLSAVAEEVQALLKALP